MSSDSQSGNGGDPHNGSPGIQQRKADHLALCASGEVEFRAKGTLLDEVALVHDALPDRHFDDIDLTTTLLGKKLKAPVVISGMTGGTPEAAKINSDLARAAEALGLGFGLGSQRAMVVAPDLGWTYRVRDRAPNALVMGNLGIVQARQMSTNAIRELCQAIGVDALCVHLATSMELIQPGGDRDFRGGRETLQRLHGELGLPIVLKETGAGLSRRVGMVAKHLGIRTVDTSGAGGTSWVGVETKRASGQARALGEELWDWGIPTAASVGLLSDLGLDIIATGGLRTGQDVCHALALGATAGGLAAPVLRAHRDGGYDNVIRFLNEVIASVRATVFLTGCRTPSELRTAPKVLGSTLRAWMEQAR
ncbi:MAG TPA: type 2 isopentenyl-diphosphate Delta-isomerase [Polyangia bacterium]|jgi:isopentenyl-diphosphate delta-isomerase|nr:type 2 isopentenyl-diphosphate Delta-isomerase [Polyangia bacterium]